MTGRSREVAALGRIRSEAWFGALIVIGAGVYLALGMGLTFVVDEWVFITDALAPRLDDLVRPYNGHWSLFPHLSYDALLAIVGLRSYLPYLVPVVLAHLVAATALFVLVRRRAGARVALVCGALFVFFGSGFESTLSAFQIGYTGSVAAGLCGIAILDGKPRDRGRVLAVSLFLVGMMSSSPAVLLLGGAIVGALVRRDLRTVVALAVPSLVYVGWYVTVAESSTTTTGAGIAGVPSFLGIGLAAAAAAPFGLSGTPIEWMSLPLLCVFSIAALVQRWRPTATLIGLVTAVAVEVLALSLRRADIGAEAAASSRYLYFAAPTVILLGAELVAWARPRFADASPRLRLGAVAITAFVLYLAFLGNLRNLIVARQDLLAEAGRVRAGIAVLLGPEGASCTLHPPPASAETQALVALPDRVDLVAAIDRFGDPRSDMLAPFGVGSPSAADTALAVSQFCPGGRS